MFRQLPDEDSFNYKLMNRRITEAEINRLVKKIVSEQDKPQNDIININQIAQLISQNPNIGHLFRKCQKELGIIIDLQKMGGPSNQTNISQQKDWFNKVNADLKKIMDCMEKKRPNLFKRLNQN